jgi:hypothetical protein
MDDDYTVARIADIEPIPILDGTLHGHPLRRDLDIGAFGVNAYTASVGELVVEPHTEEDTGHEELYVVLTGRVRFTLDTAVADLDAGHVVFCRRPGVHRKAVALEHGTMVLAIGGRRGATFQPSPWERYIAAVPLAAGGDPSAAADLVAPALADHPGNPQVLYNLACFESLAGRRSAAIGHLAEAIEIKPQVAAWARDDRDFDPVRDDPRFPAP